MPKKKDKEAKERAKSKPIKTSKELKRRENSKSERPQPPLLLKLRKIEKHNSKKCNKLMTKTWMKRTTIYKKLAPERV